MKEKTIIFLAGSSRSGTTYFDSYLGSFEDVISIGELRQIFQRSFIWNEYCSCGSFFKECTFWKDIAGEVEKKFDPLEIIKIKKSLESPVTYLKYLTTGKLSHKELNKFREAYWYILDLVFEKTSARFIVDSSKVPLFALALYKDSPYKIHYIHLTREVEGVIFSMNKLKKRKEKNPYVEESPEYMRRLSKPAGFAYWLIRNFESILISKEFSDRYFINYRDLGNKEFIIRLLRQLGIPEKRKSEQIQHIVSGNPSRFQKDFHIFRYDDKWKKEMSGPEKKVYNILGLPLTKYLEKLENLTIKSLREQE